MSRRRWERVASLDPGSFLPDFDLVEELERNLESYKVPDDQKGAWLSIPCFPGDLRTALDCVRAHCEGRRPAFSPSVAAGIDHGLGFFYKNEELRALIELRDRFHKSAHKATDSELVGMAAGFFRRLPLGIPGTMSEPGRVNVYLPQRIKKQVHERASESGLPDAALAVLCIMVTICEQTVVHPDHAELAGKTIEKFCRRVRLHRRVAEVLVEEVLV